MMQILFLKKELIILRLSTKHSIFWLKLQFPCKVNPYHGISTLLQTFCFYFLFFPLPDNSTKLNMMILSPMTNDCPASTPLIPDNILMALVQNTASMPM